MEHALSKDSPPTDTVKPADATDSHSLFKARRLDVIRTETIRRTNTLKKAIVFDVRDKVVGLPTQSAHTVPHQNSHRTRLRKSPHDFPLPHVLILAAAP